MQLGEKTTGALHVEQLLRIEIGDLKAEAVRVGALMNAAKAEFAEKLMAAQHEELNAANMRAAREREFLVQAAAQDQLFREEISRMQVELAQTLNALVVAKDKSARELQAKQQLVQESLHALALRERVNAEQIVALVQCHRGELESLRNEFEEQTASQERIHIEQRQASQAELVRLHEQIAENEREYAARFASFQEITGQEKIEWARAATLRGTEFAAQVAAFCSDIRKLELEYQRRESEHEERAEVALRESRSVHTSLEKREQELEAQLSEAKQRAKLELTEQEDFSRRTIGELEKKLATAERVSAELHNNLDLAENKLLLMRESLVWRMTTRLHRVFNKGVFPITNKSLVRRNEVVDQTQTRRSCDQQMLLMNSPAHNFQPWPRSQELNALLSCDDDRFVDNAFKIVLGRSSEPKASAFYLNRLLSGITKMQILNEISESDEAAAYAKRPYHFSGQELMPVQAAKSVDELLSHFDRDFVHVAYQTILGRGADAEGLMHYTVRLRLGAPKIKLLSEMITSQERDVLGKLICEMYAAARCYSRSKMPLLGLFWRRMYDIAGPAVADPEPLHFPEKIKTLSSLMASAKLEFVNCVYRTLLGRNPDVAGAEFYIKRLETGGSRTQLIWEILQSPECNERQILFAKLTSATTLYQLGQAAFIGWFIRKLAHVEGNTLTDVRLRSMESQLFLIAEANRRTPLSRHDLASPQDLFETQAQVDAFSKLSPAARAIYSELKAAAALQT